MNMCRHFLLFRLPRSVCSSSPLSFASKCTTDFGAASVTVGTRQADRSPLLPVCHVIFLIIEL